MSAKEYNLWIAEYQIRPWGEELADYRIGMVTQSIRAANSKEAIYMKDCMPVFEAVKKQDWKDMKRKLFGYGNYRKKHGNN